MSQPAPFVCSNSFALFFTELHFCLIVRRRFGSDDTFHSLNNAMTHGKCETHVHYLYFSEHGSNLCAIHRAIHHWQIIVSALTQSRTVAIIYMDGLLLIATISVAPILLLSLGSARQHETRSPGGVSCLSMTAYPVPRCRRSPRHHWHQFVKLYLVAGIRTRPLIIIAFAAMCFCKFSQFPDIDAGLAACWKLVGNSVSHLSDVIYAAFENCAQVLSISSDGIQWLSNVAFRIDVGAAAAAGVFARLERWRTPIIIM